MRGNLTTEEIEQLKNAESQAEWDKIADAIYEKNDFQYPLDWSDKVLFGKITPKYLREKP